jgi:hypothetical protein
MLALDIRLAAGQHVGAHPERGRELGDLTWPRLVTPALGHADRREVQTRFPRQLRLTPAPFSP